VHSELEQNRPAIRQPGPRWQAMLRSRDGHPKQQDPTERRCRASRQQDQGHQQAAAQGGAGVGHAGCRSRGPLTDNTAAWSVDSAVMTREFCVARALDACGSDVSLGINLQDRDMCEHLKICSGERAFHLSKNAPTCTTCASNSSPRLPAGTQAEQRCQDRCEADGKQQHHV